MGMVLGLPRTATWEQGEENQVGILKFREIRGADNGLRGESWTRGWGREEAAGLRGPVWR